MLKRNSVILKYFPPLNANTATIVGFTAILFWSTNVGLMRSVSLHFGAIGGAALIYSVATIILFITIGLPKLSKVPKAYLVWGSLFFISYELCLALSIGYAQNSRQAIEVGMINYLWPTFTLIFAIIFNGAKASFKFLIPGCVLAFIGIILVISGDQGIQFAQVWANIISNPLSYFLAFAAAILWAAYCSVTVKSANGQNAVTLFFALAALVLWAKFLLLGEPALNFTMDSTMTLIFAAGALGLGYGAWNIGILSGNMTLLAGASYLTPVLSALFAALLLSTALSFIFWQGVAMVTLGAILCWLATRKF